MKKDWNEFKNSGLLWLVNTILQPFGWCIVIETNEDNTVSNVYPERTNKRGFSEDVIIRSSNSLIEYIKTNSDELIKENNGLR